MDELDLDIATKLDMMNRLAATIRAERRFPIPKTDRFTRSDVVNAFTTAFEQIGGITRLALWANENEGDFYKLYSKLLPSTSLNLIQQLPDDINKMAREQLQARMRELDEKIAAAEEASAIPGECAVVTTH